LRGLALGLTVQPLTVAMMSEVQSRDLAQASSLSTVSRSVSSSLGIAVLATLVQSQSAVHYGHLAEQVTPFSRLGGLLLGLQSYFVAHGASLANAHAAALQEIALIIRGQAFILSMQDAFRFTIITIFVALIAVFFVRNRTTGRQVRPAPDRAGQLAESHADEMAAAEAMAVG